MKPQRPVKPMEASKALETLVCDDESHHGAMSYEGETLMPCFIIIIKEDLSKLIPKLCLNGRYRVGLQVLK